MISILFTGDFCPRKRIEQLVSAGNYENIYNDFLPHLQNNDLNITNLECPLTHKRDPIPKVGPDLFVGEDCIHALKYANFSLVTLSNNHILDQGEAGLLSTIELCKQNNIDYVGAGKNPGEASLPLIKEIKNKKFAFLNFSEHEFSTATDNKAGSNPLNPVKNYYDIRSVRGKADYLIVIIHGGHEGYPLPSPRMVDTYRFFIDAGADMVLGHHSHCFSGYEKYEKGLIFYGLGNFIFDSEKDRNTDFNFGFALRLIFEDEKISSKIIPYKQCNENPGVFLLSNAERINFESRIKELNNIIGDQSLLLQEWKSFTKQMKKSYLVNFEPMNSWIFRFLRHRNLIPGFLSENRKRRMLNKIQCESHRDVLIECLK